MKSYRQFTGKEYNINGIWYTYTVSALSLSDALDRFKSFCRKCPYGHVLFTRGRFTVVC